MNKPIKLFLITALCMSGNVLMQAQSIWNQTHLEEVKHSIQSPYYASAYKAIIESADTLLAVQPLSVMMKRKPSASGDKHDYTSLARYFWPDPSKSDGMPYISRDGQTNPEIDNYDRNKLGDTANRITTLSLAWYFSNDERYAQKAVELVRTWFLNKDTRMNPNLEYAQIHPGNNGNKGFCYGLIDTYSFVEMLDGVQLLEQSKAFTEKDSKELKKWFKQLTQWMLTSKQGKEDAAGSNNHSVAYDAQIIAFSLYTGNVTLAREVMNQIPQKRIFAQIEPDGRQPRELTRTLAFHYSQYNLTHLIDIFLMAKKGGIAIDQSVSADGRSFYKAMDFLASYMGRNISAWPYQQISGWEASQQNFAKDLYRTAVYLDTSRSHYRQLYRDNRVLDLKDRFNLLYFKATPVDQAYAFAANQLSYAMECATKAKQEKVNAAERRVIPRSINKDGSLAMINPYDWCSGFFAGSLWQMAAYTHSDEWRANAISWTWPIEEAKWHKGTHDLGFMMYDSFGKAFEQTGERSYRDVVLQSANTLITRFNPKVKSIRSWDHNSDVWSYPVIIDNMMNLEMLFRATQLTGDSVYWNIAVTHANTTLRNHFRPNFSCYHVVDYIPQTGDVHLKCTAQGYADDSYWSRGQSWALYGFTMCYRFTRNPAYLKQSEGIADFLIHLPNMPADGIPYWDMNMPEVIHCTPNQVNKEVPRDASAACIMASALYELSRYVSSEKGKAYRAHADLILNSLNGSYQAPVGTHYGFLLLHSTGHHPAGSEIDVPLNYADYYYLEALSRKAEFE